MEVEPSVETVPLRSSVAVVSELLVSVELLVSAELLASEELDSAAEDVSDALSAAAELELEELPHPANTVQAASAEVRIIASFLFFILYSFFCVSSILNNVFICRIADRQECALIIASRPPALMKITESV